MSKTVKGGIIINCVFLFFLLCWCLYEDWCACWCSSVLLTAEPPDQVKVKVSELRRTKQTFDEALRSADSALVTRDAEDEDEALSESCLMIISFRSQRTERDFPLSWECEKTPTPETPSVNALLPWKRQRMFWCSLDVWYRIVWLKRCKNSSFTAPKAKKRKQDVAKKLHFDPANAYHEGDEDEDKINRPSSPEACQRSESTR